MVTVSNQAPVSSSDGIGHNGTNGGVTGPMTSPKRSSSGASANRTVREGSVESVTASCISKKT